MKTPLVRILGIVLAGLSLSPVCVANAAQEGAPLPMRFAVISDPHLYTPSLGTSGSAFERYLYSGDPKLLKESTGILDAALTGIRKVGARFLIISGDLTKDGELINHMLMAHRLMKLEQDGIQVFVVPGNHDINNPGSVRYHGADTRRVANVTPKMFRTIYQRFGYNQAVSTDPASLSYVAEPAPGVWLLAIDSCKYQHNRELGYAEVSGRISPATMNWALGVLEQARTKNKQVIGVMHHGVNRHFLSEPLLFSDYLVDDWPTVSAQLAAAGLGVIFTGHYHSQDAAYPLSESGEMQEALCDIETGSLVQYPCAFRIATITETGALLVESKRVSRINTFPREGSFQAYADFFLRRHIGPAVNQELITILGLSEAEAAEQAPWVIDALVANYAGDEMPSAETQLKIHELVSSSDPRLANLGGLLATFWTDLTPTDNDLCVSLRPMDQNDIGRPSPCTANPPPVDNF